MIFGTIGEKVLLTTLTLKFGHMKNCEWFNNARSMTIDPANQNLLTVLLIELTGAIICTSRSKNELL